MAMQLNVLLQVSGLTSGRAAALIPASFGLISLIIGWLVLTRSRKGTGTGRFGVMVALFSGALGLVWSVTHLARTSSSTIGSGSGKLGAFVAIVLALIGIVLSGLALV